MFISLLYYEMAKDDEYEKEKDYFRIYCDGNIDCHLYEKTNRNKKGDTL